MHPFIKRFWVVFIAWAIGFGWLMYATHVHAAVAPPKFDGQWAISATNNCQQPPAELTIIIKGGKLATQILLDISGKISDNGKLDIVVSHDNVALYITGRLSGDQGSGTWHTDNCSGKWKAEKAGK